MIKDIREINFPSYATIYKADPNLQDMGEMTISTQLEIDGNITPDFSYDWVVLFQGSKYIAPLRNPQGAKDSEQLCATYELVFQHWAIYQLKRWLFFTVQSDSATTNVVVPDKYIADEQLNLGNLCILISRILEFYFGETITIDLNPNWEYDPEPKTISISHSFIWDVIVQLYELFGVHWQIVPNGDSEHYIIRVGYSGEDITHVFEYGFEGGLMKIERQVQDENIRNILIARGGEDNIPFRYYKDVDPNNDSFPADPDWISELKTTSFDRLRNATFRSYVQGWKAAHIADYPGYTAVGESRAYAPWAYKKGFEDKNFDPVEYVADKILTSGTLTTQISPTYSPYIEKGSSIDKYGPLQGILDNDDDCIPTIQGVEDATLGRIDEVVYCEQVTSDDIQEIPTSEHYTKKFWDNHEYSLSTLEPEERKEFSIQVGIFTVPKGKNCNFDVDMAFIRNSQWIIFEDSYYIVAVDRETNKEYGGVGLPEGTYTLYIKGELCNTSTDKTLSADFRISVTYTTFVPASTKGRTWDIWIKNIWGTFLALDESPEQYAERVWLPILGNHLGDEAAVMFSTGALSVSDDYEFLIAKIPEYDDSKSIQSSDGKTYQSHWKITLVRSDADYESLGVYIPSTQRQGKAGDKFLFTGIELPHNYVLWAERKIDERATDKLDKVKDIKPTFVVEFDPLRLHGIDTDRTLNDLSKYIKPGASMLIKDKRLTNNDTERLTIQSVQYHYGAEEDSLLPNIEVTLGTTYQTSGGTIQQMQGDIESLQRMVGSVSNIRQVVLSTGEKYFLSRTRNDRASGHIRFTNGLSIGTSDSDKAASVDTAGNAEFNSLIVRTLADIYDSLKIRGKLTALASASISGGLYSLYPDFISGFSGQGWAIENGAKGESRAEFDTLTIRKALTVYELIIRKIRSVGGAIICSAANGKIKSVETSGNNYVITFEDECQFQADDLMRCQTFTGNTLKSYWVRITSATTESVTIAKSEFNGTTPEVGDECVLMGNATNDKRQSAIYISAAEDGRPVIDILNGIKTASTAGCLRGRFGALDGISDSAFPEDHQPQGYGLYSDNAYLKGEFILSSSGESVSTLIEATSDHFSSEISKIQGDIRTNEQDISNLSTRIVQTENAISAQANSIKSVTEDVNNNIKPGLEQAQKDIGETRDNLTKLDASTTTKITELQSSFNIKAEEISSEVTKVTTSISSSGRNMLLDTNQGKTNWSYNDNSGITYTMKDAPTGGVQVTRPSNNRSATWERFSYVLRPQLIITGQKYTVSFKAINNTSSTAKTQFNIYIANPNGTETLTNAVATEINSGTAEAQYVVTLTAKATGTSSGVQSLNIFPHGDCVNNWTDISIRDLQLERGEIATEYMPSNEDYVNETKETLSSSITQTAEEIRSEVSKQITDSETNITKAYTSAIKQTADNINLSVTSLESNVNSMQDEVDAVNSGLKTTGIDINTGEVTISADKVTFTNSNGVKQALLTNGKLNAKALESESLTVQNAANENQRIEILPQSGKFGMNIYNGSSLVQSLTADTYNNGASDLFAEEIEALSISNPSGSASTGNVSSATSPVILLSPRLAATPRTIYITGGTLTATAKCSIPTSSSGLQQTYQSTANITLDLQHSSTSAFTSDVTTINLVATQAQVSSVGTSSAQSQTNTVNAINGTGAVPAGRYYRIVISFINSANGTPISTNSASVSWSGISAQNWSHEYLSRHFANGIVLGSSIKDYFDVHYDNNDAFTMRMETGGSGLLVQTKVDEYTNDMATLIGGYQAPMQRLICHGFVKYLNDSGYKMHYQGLRINNGSTVSLKYPSGGTYRTMLAFSNDFKALLERLLGEDYIENNNANNEHYCGLEKHLFCHINTRSTTNVRAVTSLTTDGFITDAVGAYEDFTFDIYYV